MRRFPKIFIDVTLGELSCRDCRRMIPAMNAVYIIPLTQNGAANKACCEICAMREIDRRIAIVKDEEAMERAKGG